MCIVVLGHFCTADYVMLASHGNTEILTRPTPPLGDVNAVGTSSQLMTPVCSSHHFSGQSHANTHTHTHACTQTHTYIHTNICTREERCRNKRKPIFMHMQYRNKDNITHKIYKYLFCIHIHYTNMDITYTYEHMYAEAKTQS